MALALGSGGARGYAHIGAIEVLEERGFEIVAISGTSMGALVGGVRAAGALTAYSDWARSLTQREVWRLLDLTLTAPGAIRAERIIAKVSEIVGGALIEDLPIPFTAVATDLHARREVWFQHGPLHHAIRASIAIPGFITPVVFNGRLLVDGGLLNPVPIEPTVIAAADLIVGVSLNGERTLEGNAPVRASAEPRPFDDWAERLRQTPAGRAMRRLPHRRPRDLMEEPAPEALPKDLGVTNMLTMSFDTMSALISRYRMATNPPDVLVTVPISAARTLDFHKAAQMIDLGRKLMDEELDRLGY